MTMQIERFDAATDNARLRRCYELAAAAQRTDDPGLPVRALPYYRRLGLLVKAAMLDLLARHEPTVRHILTGNAADNDHMVAINTRLGFTVASVSRTWDLDLAIY